MQLPKEVISTWDSACQLSKDPASSETEMYTVYTEGAHHGLTTFRTTTSYLWVCPSLCALMARTQMKCFILNLTVAKVSAAIQLKGLPWAGKVQQ